MQEYGMGPNLDCIITSYWEWQRIVSKTGKFLRKEFRTRRGLMQGYPVSPTVFNIVVDVVVWAVLDGVCGPQEA